MKLMAKLPDAQPQSIKLPGNGGFVIIARSGGPLAHHLSRQAFERLEFHLRISV